MTKQGIDYLQGVYATCARRARENKSARENRPELLVGAFALETSYNNACELIHAISQFERFPLPSHDEIFKEAPHD